MNDLFTAIENLIPEKYRPFALAVLVLLPRGFYAWNQGGDLRKIIGAMFLGTNAPAPTPAATASAAPGSKVPLLLALWGFLLCASLTGCTTSQQGIAYKADTAVQTSVETVMNAWGDYVKQYHPDDATRAKVKAAYLKYQAAHIAVLDAEQFIGTLSATNALPGDVSAAKDRQTTALNQAARALNDLVSLVESFGVKI